MPPIRVLIADDHAIIREALDSAIALAAGLELVGQAATGAEAVEFAIALDPDVTVLDIRLPDLDGIEALKQILSKDPDARVVMLTSYDTEDDVVRAIEAGACGYLLKGSSSKEVMNAIRTAHSGGSSLEPSVAATLLAHMAGGARIKVQPREITAREMEILRLISRGFTNLQIGAELNIAEGTVKTHVSHIFGKLEANDRTEAVVRAAQIGLIDL